MRIRNLQFCLVAILTLVLAGCVAGGGGRPGWPVETFHNTCGVAPLPFEPLCLSGASIDGGFDYPGQFEACRQSVASYGGALREYYRCSSFKLKKIFDDLLKAVPAALDCHERNLRSKGDPDRAVACSPVEAPKFVREYQADGLAYDFGIPRCVTSNSSLNSLPVSEFAIDLCREEVDLFAGKGSRLFLIGENSAQGQYDKYMKNLKNLIEEKISDAVDKFNCLAERRRYCI